MNLNVNDQKIVPILSMNTFAPVEDNANCFFRKRLCNYSVDLDVHPSREVYDQQCKPVKEANTKEEKKRKENRKKKQNKQIVKRENVIKNINLFPFDNQFCMCKYYFDFIHIIQGLKELVQTKQQHKKSVLHHKNRYT